MHKAVEAKALSLVGQGYIYGAKGQTCSPVFRQQQAAQYPEQEDNILTTGAKWDGKLEPGAETDDVHAEVGAYARECGITTLLTLGAASAHAAASFGEGAVSFENLQKLKLPEQTLENVMGKNFEDFYNSIN